MSINNFNKLANLFTIFFYAGVILYFSACTLTGGSEVIDYSSTKKTKILDIPPDLSKNISVEPIKSSVNLSDINKEKERTSSGAVKLDVGVDTEAKIVDQGVYRYLETKIEMGELWEKINAFLKDAGLDIAESNAKVGTIYTDWAENRAKYPTSSFREYIGKIIPGVVSTGELDRYQVVVEKRADKNRVYLAHYGVLERERPGTQGSFQWVYREREPLLEMEMLKRLAIFLGNAKAEPQKLSSNKNIGKVNSGNTITINAKFDEAWDTLIAAIPNNGFILNGQDKNTKTIYVLAQEPMSYAPENKEQQFPPFNILLNEKSGVTTASFEFVGAEKNPQVDITKSLQKLVQAINI